MECRLGLSFKTCERNPTSSRRVRAIPAQECEGRVRAAAAENSRELDGVVHGYCAELRIRHRPRVRAQTKYRSLLSGECIREAGAVCEVFMQNFFQLGMRDAQLSPPNRSHASDGGAL